MSDLQSDYDETHEVLAEAQQEITRLRQRVGELEDQITELPTIIRRYEKEIAELHGTISAIHNEYRQDVQDAELFRKLQNMDPVKAQAFFWNYKSRKQRAEAIHDYHFN